jgi:surfactin synthase thioesterase subunit
MLPGDHFFLNGARDLVTEAVARDLAALGPAAQPLQPQRPLRHGQ